MKPTTLTLGLLLAVALLSSAPSSAAEPSIAQSADETSPLKRGDKIPDVSVMNAEGESIELRSFHQSKPVVIVFFRGSWCPICSRHFTDLIAAYPRFTDAGATMIAISPDTVENTKGNIQKLETPFPLLSDSNVAVAKAFGLAFHVDDATVTKYRGFGIDLEKASGARHHALPIPAVYIVDTSGTITFAHSDPDYTKRLDAEVIVQQLQQLK
jgi:peroxiredoxin